MESILIYSITILICVLIVIRYVWKGNKKSKQTAFKVETAKAEGRFEPISLHPHVNLAKCIGSGACITACPEKDIIGIVSGKATVINTTSCIGHGACFHACPVDAITLRIGTETRGVELPHVKHTYETNVNGIYIAGELGGMGLIKNSVEQGKQAVTNLAKNKQKSIDDILDLVIIGAGPAGISASLEAKRLGLNFKTLEQDSLGGTVYTYPREKLVMTHPMDLPIHGKVKLFETTKDELIELWEKVLSENQIEIQENTRVQQITNLNDRGFLVNASTGDFKTQQVLVAIGRRGSPRKLGVPGEVSKKVAYRLLEPEEIKNKNILIVGGGDSAVESAMLLMNQNNVTLSYRKDNFTRIKPGNKEKIDKAIDAKIINPLFGSAVQEIQDDTVLIKGKDAEMIEIENDLIYIFIGGELPIPFLKEAGIEVSKNFGKIVRKH